VYESLHSRGLPTMTSDQIRL